VLDLRLRRHKEALIGPAARRLAPWVAPVWLTLAAFAVTAFAAGAAWAALSAVAASAWLFARLLDGLDGAVARARGSASDLGGYLDMVLDTAGYSLVPLGVAASVDTRAGWVLVAVLLGSFYVNAISWAYLAAVLEKRSAGSAARGELTSITMPPGVVEGAETIALYTALLAVPRYAVWIFAAMAAGVLAGVVQRLIWARRTL
jgi:phosphatidylglycerophosphate synthase